MHNNILLKNKKQMPAQPPDGLVKGIECLLLLCGADSPLGSRELARMMGVDASKANRMLKTLSGIGMAVQDDNRKYLPGPGLHVLSAISLRASGLLQASLEPIRILSKKSNSDVALGVLWQRQVCYIYHGGHSRTFEESIAGHNLYPAEKSSVGRALMSRESDAVLEQLYGCEFIDSLQENERNLREILCDVRMNGFAISSQNNSLAVNIGGISNAALALTDISGKNKNELVDMLNETATGILKSLSRS